MADLSEATKVGGRAQAVDYVFAANFAAYGYDWLLSILEELEIVSRSGLSPPIVIYFLSRSCASRSGTERDRGVPTYDGTELWLARESGWIRVCTRHKPET
ncbi:hypothetical protein FIBSPDRAFT_899335 [Athelia psychrophila]|uniref:DUF6533 domain-containing protein n=1 Tax=Athelia psychrophila TaxID=1759441 RepID=A0A165ZWC7_9AGAM|nr:hypothetical protein FIBSPDRAFT_899335 [Fibularhizoctonia sp. CBS 109695]